MNKHGSQALLAAAWVLGLAGCGSSATRSRDEMSVQPARYLAATVARMQAHRAAPPPGAAAGSAQLNTITDLPEGFRFAVPQVMMPNAAAGRRINAVLTRRLLTDFLTDSTRSLTATQAIERAVAEYNANGQIGVFGTSFEVLYNQKNVLSLALTTEYSGAYPWSATRHVTFDLRTGLPLVLADLLADTLALRQRWHARIDTRLAAYQQQVAREYKNDADTWATVRDYTGWSDTLRQLRPAARPPLREFACTAQGLVLYTSFEFPHAAMALAPPDEYLFSYARLRPWLAPGSLLQAWH